MKIFEFKRVFVEGKGLSKSGKYISIDEDEAHFFRPDLYETLIHGKPEDLTVLSSIIKALITG